jgi:4'-phosphopantetheinyl transferase
MTSPAAKWNRTARHHELGRCDVHVWRAFLDEPPHAVGQYRAVLTLDKLERAARHRFEKDSSAFVIARGALRILLGRYLNRPPQSLRFEANDYGKPFLPGAVPLRFRGSLKSRLFRLPLAGPPLMTGVGGDQSRL